MDESKLLNPVVMELMVDRFGSHCEVSPRLSCACKAYNRVLPVPEGVKGLREWLVQQDLLEDSVIYDGLHMVFAKCKIVQTGQREWRFSAYCGRRTSQVFHNSGLIRLGKYSLTLRIMGWWSQWNVYKDSFHGVQNLDSLKKCLATHTILCHEDPAGIPTLPDTVRHRHRDNVPWTWARAFYVWRAAIRQKDAWSGRDMMWANSMVLTSGPNSIGRVRMI
jgi:hypothetical protein